jgi:hypothetical protein
MLSIFLTTVRSFDEGPGLDNGEKRKHRRRIRCTLSRGLIEWQTSLAAVSSAGFSGISLFAITEYCFGGRVVDAVNTPLIFLDSFGSCQEFVGGICRRQQTAPRRAVSGHLDAKYVHTSGTNVETGRRRRNWPRLDVTLRDTQSSSRVRDRAPRGRRWICR